MSISNVIVQVADLGASTEFYRRHLDGQIVYGDPEHTLLDFVTATLELRRLEGGRSSLWSEDDAVQGFRHIGFKVADVDKIVDGLDASGVRIRSRPQDLEREGIRIAFFFDPDGTVLEIVQRHLQYHVIRDEKGVAAERRLPEPERPRFDHVGHSVHDQPSAVARYERAGFTNIGAFWWPTLHLEFMRSEQTVVELFRVPDRTLPAQLRADSYGFVGVELAPAVEGLVPVGTLADGRLLFGDPDGLGVVQHPAHGRRSA